MSQVFPWFTCYKTLPWLWHCKPAVFMLETQSSLSPSTIHTTVLLWLHTCSSHFKKHLNESGTILWVVLKSWMVIFESFCPSAGILNRNSCCLRPSRTRSPSKRWLLRNAVSIQAFFGQHISVGMPEAFPGSEPFPPPSSCPVGSRAIFKCLNLL